MPSLKAHCAISEQRTRSRFEELHRWIDNPPEAKNLGVDHRIERHAFKVDDMNYINQKWGNKAVIEWLFHIAIDNIHTAFKFSKDYYGEYTYNLIKIGIETSGFIHVKFDRAKDYQLKKKF